MQIRKFLRRVLIPKYWLIVFALWLLSLLSGSLIVILGGLLFVIVFPALGIYLEFTKHYEITEIAVPRSTKDFNITPKYIPSADGNPYITKKNEPSENQLEEFFSDPENWNRLFFSSEILIDPLDCWEISGHQDGFLFICERKYKGFRTMGDMLLVQGAVTKTQTLKNGRTLNVLSAEVLLNQRKYDVQRITKGETPETFNWLISKLQAEELLLPEQTSEN